VIPLRHVELRREPFLVAGTRGEKNTGCYSLLKKADSEPDGLLPANSTPSSRCMSAPSRVLQGASHKQAWIKTPGKRPTRRRA
jgi:hypothetical protein